MRYRRLVSLATLLTLVGVAPAFAQSTFQRWTFNTNPPDKNNIPPDEVENPYPPPPKGSAPDASHQATVGTHVGVLIQEPSDVIATFSVSNVKVPGRKDVFISAVFKSAPDQAPAVNVKTANGGFNLFAQNNQLISDPDADGFRVYSRTFSTGGLLGCPDVKAEFWAPEGTTLALDDLSIRTTCFPRFAVPAVSATKLGVLVVSLLGLMYYGYSRKRRILGGTRERH